MRFRILGPLEVWEDEDEHNLGRGRQRALLAFLLLRRNEVVSADRIVDALWDDGPPPTAQKVVQGYVSQLRRTLGDGVLVTRPTGYMLVVAPGDADVDLFQQLVERAQGERPREAARTLIAALGLWRGTPFADVAYESFAQGEIARLEELRLAALEDRIDADLALGRASKLVSELEGLVRDHPLRERLRAQLMVALYRSGRQADALEAYADTRSALREGLGLEPGPQLQTLQRRILEHDPTLGRAGPPPLAVVAAHRWKLLGAGIVLLVAGAAFATVELAHGKGQSPAVVRPNSVALLDPRSGRIVGDVGLGSVPTRVAVGAGAAWTVNADDRTIARIDPRTRSVRTFSTGASVIDVAVAGDAAWVANGNEQSVSRVDPQTTSVAPLRLPPRRGSEADWIAADRRAVWVSGGPQPQALAWHVDPNRRRVVESVTVADGGLAVALGAGSAWIRGDQGLSRLDERSGSLQAHVDIPWNAFVTEDSPGVAFGAGGVWVTSSAGGVVWHVDPMTNLPVASVPVGDDPRGVAVGAGSVWVAGGAEGTVVQIDPEANRVLRTIRVGGHATGIAVGFGFVWVTVD